MKNPVNPGNALNTPMWEKVLGLLGLLLLCIGFIYLGWNALSEQQLPPEIVLSVKEVNDLEQGYLVQIEVVNTGSQSVAGLHFEGSLLVDNINRNSTEISNATLDYVPARSKKSAGLYFSNDPRVGILTLRALGYQTP